MLTGICLISEAAELAAHRHAGQRRKGRAEEPTINHLAEVANLVSIATKGEDPELVAAGWLHDTLEDTETSKAELIRRFGERVALLVQECTDDMSLQQSERRRRQVEDAAKKSPGARLIKIADKISNIRARIHPDPTPDRREELADYLAFAEQVVKGCRGVNGTLERLFDDNVAEARCTL